MTAFGPYKEIETVDFQDLGDHRLFVISGATGSGKTTIFDGISFALYGQASGEDRTDIRAMRSDFADNDVQTSVELIFEIHQRKYRIMRQIPYTKTGNKTETSANCEFYEQTETGEIPIVDRQIVSEINKKIEALIGFTQAQFSQIVMLPQGEFRKFLTSDTENKETILRKIFKTEPYREVVERLKVKKDQAQASLTKEKQQSDVLIQQIASRLPERDALIFNVLQQENYNVKQVMEGLVEEQVFYDEKIKVDQHSYKQAYENHSKTLEHYHQAKGINEKFEALTKRRILFEELTAQVPMLEEKSKKLQQAEQALAIEQIERQYFELEKEARTKKGICQQAHETLNLAVKRVEEIETQYKIEADKKTEREQVSEQLLRLTDALPVVSELKTKQDELAKLKKELEDLSLSFEKTGEASEVKTAKLREIQSSVEALEKQLLSADDKVDELSKITEKHRVIEEYFALEKTKRTYEQVKNEKEKSFLSFKEIHEKLAENWLMNEAATLAETLHDGEACPVCGSADHPHKAVHTASISKEALALSNEQLAKVESDYRTAVANYTSATGQLDTKKNEMVSLSIDVTHIEQQRKDVMLLKEQLTTEVAEHRKARTELTALKTAQQNQAKLTEQLTDKKVHEERTLFEKKSLFEKETAVLESRITAIPEEVRELHVLEQKLSTVQSQKTALDQAWEHIQKLREEGQREVTIGTSAAEHAQKALEEVEEKLGVARERFMAALKGSEFPSEEAFHQAKMDERTRTQLKTEIEEFKQRYYAVREAIKELTAALEGKEHVELSQVEKKLHERKEASETALRAYNHSMEYATIIKELVQSMVKSSEKVIQYEEVYSKVTDVYDVVRGHNGLKLSFERYIQIEYLEQIIQSANERLREMSSGQFELMRSDRQEVRGRQSGLGLDVYDAYTGQMRDVKTMSGGEKFNASLCLALGMADVIQSFQGSVSIDTMFIDEGFGSLDEESLSRAIDTLIDLQKSGRMIGVISHVEELKTAFPAILEVNKSKAGHSTTRFILK